MKKIVNMFANDYSTAHWQRKVSFWIIFVAIPVMIVAGDALFGKNTPGDIIVFCAAILGGLAACRWSLHTDPRVHALKNKSAHTHESQSHQES